MIAFFCFDRLLYNGFPDDRQYLLRSNSDKQARMQTEPPLILTGLSLHLPRTENTVAGFL